MISLISIRDFFFSLALPKRKRNKRKRRHKISAEKQSGERSIDKNTSLFFNETRLKERVCKLREG
jgi:hypothetical protein